MIRKTLTILSLIGLLLSVGLWGVSYWQVGFILPPKIGLAAFSGTVDLGLLRENGYVAQNLLANLKSQSVDARVVAGSVVWSRGFTNWRTDFWWFACETFDGMTLIRFPLWLPCLLFAATPLYYLIPLHRRRKREKLGLCVKWLRSASVEGAVSGVWGRVSILSRVPFSPSQSMLVPSARSVARIPGNGETGSALLLRVDVLPSAVPVQPVR